MVGSPGLDGGPGAGVIQKQPGLQPPGTGGVNVSFYLVLTGTGDWAVSAQIPCSHYHASSFMTCYLWSHICVSCPSG